MTSGKRPSAPGYDVRTDGGPTQEGTPGDAKGGLVAHDTSGPKVSSISQRTSQGETDTVERPALWRRPRAMFWTAAGLAVLGFLVALEIAARRIGVEGPMTSQVKDLVYAPKPGPLYAGLALL